jgi:hypothetical protein
MLFVVRWYAKCMWYCGKVATIIHDIVWKKWYKEKKKIVVEINFY